MRACGLVEISHGSNTMRVQSSSDLSLFGSVLLIPKAPFPGLLLPYQIYSKHMLLCNDWFFGTFFFLLSFLSAWQMAVRTHVTKSCMCVSCPVFPVRSHYFQYCQYRFIKLTPSTCVHAWRSWVYVLKIDKRAVLKY